jgi:hypothetical protein
MIIESAATAGAAVRPAREASAVASRVFFMVPPWLTAPSVENDHSSAGPLSCLTWENFTHMLVVSSAKNLSRLQATHVRYA